jgi:hypothetical protein
MQGRRPPAFLRSLGASACTNQPESCSDERSGSEKEQDFTRLRLLENLDGMTLAAGLFARGNRRSLGLREGTKSCQRLAIETQQPPTRRRADRVGGVLVHKQQDYAHVATVSIK